MNWKGLETIGDAYRRNASERSAEVAFVAQDSSLTFGALNERVNRLNAALAAAGLTAGDRVVVLAMNRPEIFEVCGVSKTGLIPVPLNWRFTAEGLQKVLEDCRPAAIVAEGPLHPLVAGYVAGLAGSGERPLLLSLDGPDGDWLDYERVIASGSADEVSSTVHPDDTACIVYTSGTTGEPKGAELSHRALLANTQAVIEQAGIVREGDVVLSVMPLFHVGGMWYYAFPAFALGCKVVILREFRPTEVIDTLRREACTAAHFVPTMIAELLQHDDIAVAADSLRVVFYAGSSIPGEVLRTALSVLSGCDLVQGYGSTESAGISFLTASDHRRALTDAHILSSCGSPFAHVEVRIDEPDSSGIGEILVKSPNLMKGYWGKPDRTAAVVRDGWLYTGDLGRFDEEGHLFVVDRKNDMVVSGGENVYPFEVEEALREHPAVGDCAVFGVPDQRWVERVVAAVVVRPGAEVSADDIIGSARTRLPGYKCPKQVIFVDELPKSGAGKVLRKALREKFTDPAAV